MIEPGEWTVVFSPHAANWFFRIIALGRFKHVWAFAFLHELKTWLIYDVQYGGTRITAFPDSEHSQSVITAMIEGCDLVTVKRQEGNSVSMRFGFFCVPAIKHLLGIKSHALRPDSLLRCVVSMPGSVHHRRHGSEASTIQFAAARPPSGAA